MMQVIPNSGLLGDDRLDKLRGDAVMASITSPLPTEVSSYIQAIEARLTDIVFQQKKAGMREIYFHTVDGKEP